MSALPEPSRSVSDMREYLLHFIIRGEEKRGHRGEINSPRSDSGFARLVGCSPLQILEPVGRGALHTYVKGLPLSLLRRLSLMLAQPDIDPNHWTVDIYSIILNLRLGIALTRNTGLNSGSVSDCPTKQAATWSLSSRLRLVTPSRSSSQSETKH